MSYQTIRDLKAQYGSNSPAAAEQLNSIASELQRQGNIRTALKYYQESLTILEFNKCNALLYDFEEESKAYAIDMAMTLRKIGSLVREMNNFVGAAEIYKECLDVFLEGLINGGGSLKRRLLECESKHDSYRYQSIFHQVDRKTIGRILCLNPEFRNTVREITELFQEIQLVKFVGQNAAQSRRRRKMVQQRAVEENLKHAVESLSMESKSCKGEEENNHEEKKGHCSQMPRSINVGSAHSPSHRQAMTRSMSWTSTGAESDTWMRCFWEKDAARFSRPRPLSRRAVTSEEEYDYYKALSSTLGPSEDSLVVALRRFPLPKSVVGDNKCLRQNSSSLSSPSDSLHGGGCGSPTNDSFYHGVCAERDSEERMVPPSHHLAGENLSPRCVTKPIFQEDSIYKKGETDGSVYRYKDDTEDSVYRYKDDTSTSW